MILQAEKSPFLKLILKESTKFIEFMYLNCFIPFFHIYRRIMYHFNNIPQIRIDLF